MSYKNDATRVSEAKQIVAVLVGFEARLPEELSSTKLTDIVTAIEDQSIEIKKLKADLDAAMDTKKKKLRELGVFMKRLRLGTKSVFGDDSLEYERVGGTRRSEYKHRSKNETPTAV